MNRVCVIIPVYNNEKTVKNIVLGAKDAALKVIVMNDGSTDLTGEILASLASVEDVTVFSFEKNKGKGVALQKGFEIALENGFTHAISIDADGQHFCEWIKNALDECEKSPEKLLVGARIGENIGEKAPSKNLFARRLGNLWIKIYTGFSLSDTQSGFRVYPIEKMKKIRFKTTRFEFEQEVLIESAWNGIKVEEFAIPQYYQPPNERVSHYRAFSDSVRISCFFAKTAFSKFGRVFVAELSSNISPRKAALSFSLGIFFGIFPVWGFQGASAIFVATFAKLNRPLALLGTQISIPPMIPFIVFAAVWLGKMLFFSDLQNIDTLVELFSENKAEFFLKCGKSYVAGSVVLAILAGFFSYLIVYPFCKALKKMRKD
jgi:glycosyltransferase involved in cell wall biosynthesis